MLQKACVLALTAFGLVACDGLPDQIAALGVASDATSEGIRTLSVLGGDVRVRGPEGYCIDQRASNARRGFAVMAGCALMADAAVMPSLDGLITVQFGDSDTASVSGNEEAFAAFLKSEAGQSVLSRDGDAGSITGLTVIADRAGVLARFEDTSETALDGTSGAQWRGFLDIEGRLTTISVLSFDRNTLSRSEGQRLLVVAMAQLSEVNAPTAAAE